jgi:hypothetical protein
VRHLPPVRWADVTPGTVVLLNAPRTIVFNENYEGIRRLVWAEGIAPFAVRPDDPAYPVELDAADAVGTLFAAGLNPAPIEGTS